MNYLAHALLAGRAQGLLLGAIMGDFVKGPLGPEWPPEVRAGLILHRRIDRFTDQHPTVCRSRARIEAPRRRFAGIIVDMSYDHFLALEWHYYSVHPLRTFTRQVYGALRSAGDLLPARLARIAPRMCAEDWLASYARIDALGRAIDGIAGRRPRAAPLQGAVHDIVAAYAGLQGDFRAFFPEVIGFARRERRELTAAP